jgi:RNA polymerase sigma factor (sigma-70 family)
MSNSLSDLERQRLVAENLGCVQAALRSLLPVHSSVCIDDLIGAGHLGLVRASLRYIPNDKTEFATFAYPRVRGEMKEILIAATRRLKEYERLPDLDLEDAEDVEPEVPEAFQTRDMDPERSTLCRQVIAAVERLPATERMVVKLHFFEDWSLTDLAKKLGVSKVTIGRYFSRALAGIREQLDDPHTSWPLEKPKKKTQFSPAFKAKIVSRVRQGDLSITRIARMTNVPATNIRAWLKRATPEQDSQSQLVAA